MMEADLEDELTCCVCLELYDEPLILPCSHNICKKCASELILHGTGATRRLFQCPKCRGDVKLDPCLGLEGLQGNRVLDNIIKVGAGCLLH